MNLCFTPLQTRLHTKSLTQASRLAIRLKKDRITSSLLLTCACAAFAALPVTATAQKTSAERVEVSFSSKLLATPVNGRLQLILSKDGAEEPRFQVRESGLHSQQVFGIDVDQLQPGHAEVVDNSAQGYPLPRLADVPAGDYFVQAVLNRYTTFHRADGHIVQLPMDEGEGQNWAIKPGNLISLPARVHIDPHASAVVRIQLSSIIPPITPPEDTAWVKHVRIQSPSLSQFWGQPIYLGAIVLLPYGWQSHPDVHYPLLVQQGHFAHDLEGFRPAPPPASWTGFRKTRAEAAHAFYEEWTTGKLPHLLLVEIQHANQYGDDSYAVDSANIGPYGYAITHELIPYIERVYRGIGQGWARANYGGSTGGWEALASQIFYPNFYNGAWSFCPDPVDFSKFQLVDIYHDNYALWSVGPWTRLPRGEMRDLDGSIETTMEDEQRRTLALGSHGRSGQQMDLWQATWSPVGSGGYPRPLWNPQTGVIDRRTVAYWRDHYDLTAILTKNWETLGPSLAGKLHIYAGTADTYYLNLAVQLMQKKLSQLDHPRSDAEFHYGLGQPHCYTGDPDAPARIGALTATQRVMKEAAAHMRETAPSGADLSSWAY